MRGRCMTVMTKRPRETLLRPRVVNSVLVDMFASIYVDDNIALAWRTTRTVSEAILVCASVAMVPSVSKKVAGWPCGGACGGFPAAPGFRTCFCQPR